MSGRIDYEVSTANRAVLQTGGVFSAGLDLGRDRDPAALVVVEIMHLVTPWTPGQVRDRPERAATAGSTEDLYVVRFAKRWPLGTRYRTVLEEAARVIDAPPLRERTRLRYDQSGVGQAVVDLVETLRYDTDRASVGLRGLPLGISSPIGTVITAGEGAGVGTVSKSLLVTGLEIALQDGRLKVPKGLAEREALEGELRDFQASTTAAGHTTWAASGSRHDDLVSALCLAILEPGYRRWMWRGRAPHRLMINGEMVDPLAG